MTEKLYRRDKEAAQLLRDTLKLRTRAERLGRNLDRPSQHLDDAMRLLLLVANHLAEVNTGD